MNKLKSTMLVGAGVTTIGLTGLGIANTSFAMSGSTDASGHMKMDYKDSFDAALSAKLASKFNLDKSDVQKVIDEVRQEQKDAMKDKWHNELKQALSDGKITQEQYDHITTEMAKIDTMRDSLKDESSSERKATIKEMRSTFNDLRKWMKDEDISIKALGFEFHQHKGHMKGEFHHRRY